MGRTANATRPPLAAPDAIADRLNTAVWLGTPVPVNPLRGTSETAVLPCPPAKMLNLAGARFITKSAAAVMVTVIFMVAIKLPDVPLMVNCDGPSDLEVAEASHANHGDHRRPSGARCQFHIAGGR